MARPKNAAISDAMRKQDEERKARRSAAASKKAASSVVPKGPRTSRAKQVVAPKAKADKGQSKASIVRAYIEANPDAKHHEVAKATGVAPAYVWDIRAAMARKAAKASEAPAAEAQAEEAPATEEAPAEA